MKNWIGWALGGLVTGALAWVWIDTHSVGVPAGIEQANGRVQVERIDISAKYPGRLVDVLVDEGQQVQAGSVMAHEDTVELQAQRAEAMAARLRAIEATARARAEVNVHEVQAHVAQLELDHAEKLLKQSLVSQAEVDRRQGQRDGEKAGILAARAAVGEADAARQQAEAQIQHLDVVMGEMTLKAPVAGRVEYRIAEPGAVIPSGGRVVTLLDTSKIYMTVFVPTRVVGRLAVGDEARIVLDAMPEFVWPAHVTFTGGEAQFTPKTVETGAERANMMYRVKLAVPDDLAVRYMAYVKAGLTGYGYIRTDPKAQWPQALAIKLPPSP